MSEKGPTVNNERVRASAGKWLQHLREATADQLWIGPRPLREDEDDRLVGRDEDIREVAKWLRLTKLIHLTGVSGVGKSSMLMAGLIPQLRKAGYTVAYCRKWDLRDETFVDHVAHALYESLGHDPIRGLATNRFHDDGTIFWDLDNLKGTAVIILDQFEEFLRAPGQSISAAVEALIAIHENMNVRIILSYRSEYKYLAEDLDRDPRVQSSRAIKLVPIPKPAALELIGSPKSPLGAGPDWDPSEAIDDDAVAEIHHIWATAPPFRDGTGDVGLLHLQAMLSVLDSYRAGGRVTRALVDDYRRRAVERHREFDEDEEHHEAMMRFALEESVSVRLAQAETAANLAGMDSPAIVGTSSLLAEVVPHLSSGGYKVNLQVHDLAEKVLDEQLEQLRGDLEEQLEADEVRLGVEGLEPDELASNVSRALILTLTADLFDGNAGNDGESLVLTRYEAFRRAVESDESLPPFDWWIHNMWEREDDRYGSSGLMLGASPLQVLIEQFRRFAWALAWLAHLDIATVGGGVDDEATVSLVHDGFGRALRSWAERYEEGNATAALYSIATRSGLSHDWAPLERDEEKWRNRYVAVLSGTADAPKFHFNLGFRGNVIIGAEFRHAVFVNCEFTGTVFIRCLFTSATFLNCRLDGALFDSCIIGDGSANESAPPVRTQSGPSAPGDLGDLDHPVVYSVGNPENTAQLLAMYRERNERRVDAVLAQPPGRAATPATAAEAADAAPWKIEDSSGLVIHGSRVQAIILRQTVFRGERILFRRVRGSGVELGEMSGFAGIDIQRSLIRHLTLTSEKNELDEPLACTLDLRVLDSIAAQWWFGDSIVGKASFAGSRLGQIWTESSDLKLDVDETCISTDVVSGDAILGERLPARDAAQQLVAADDRELALFRHATAAMDYRQRPEVAHE